MANEISVSAALSCTKDLASMSISGSRSIDMVGSDMIMCTQHIGTSAEALSLGDISPPAAYIYVRNLDATNFVDLCLVNDGTEKFAHLKPGQFILFPPPVSGTIYAIADTATCDCQVAAVEL